MNHGKNRPGFTDAALLAGRFILIATLRHPVFADGQILDSANRDRKNPIISARRGSPSDQSWPRPMTIIPRRPAMMIATAPAKHANAIT